VSAHASYRHTQWFTAMWLSLPLPALFVSVAALRESDAHLMQALGIAWGVCVVGLASFGRLVIELRDDRLHWTFGLLGWPRWDLLLQEIERVQCVRTSAWRGAGIKALGKDKLFSVSIGGPALRLDLSGGRIVTLGTPEPERLAALIEARRPPPR
jgi:hypothetical protein